MTTEQEARDRRAGVVPYAGGVARDAGRHLSSRAAACPSVAEPTKRLSRSPILARLNPRTAVRANHASIQLRWAVRVCAVCAVLVSAALALFACTGTLAKPEAFEQRLSYAYATLAATRDEAATLLDYGDITVDEARGAQSRADQVQVGLDASKAALDAGKPESAMESLEAAQMLLRELERYLQSKRRGTGTGLGEALGGIFGAIGGGIAGGIGTGSSEPLYPQFPWPPPRASATERIPPEMLAAGHNGLPDLAALEERIRNALDKTGYFEKRYFAVPDGYAMVTRLERINPDGSPVQGESRWVQGRVPLRTFSLQAFLSALFFAEPGHFRVIAFIVSPHPFSQTEVSVTREEATEWLSTGLNALPSEIGSKRYTPQYATTALIYEFEQEGDMEEAKVNFPGRLQGRTHLQRAGLWEALGR